MPKCRKTEKEPSQQPAEPNMITVVKGGDVILVCGGQKPARLLVSAVVLTNTSKVFEAMLGPNYAEGQVSRSAEKPQELELKENSADAMLDLCCLIHNQETNITEHDTGDIATERLFELALVADEYDCISSLKLQCEAIMSRFLDRETTDELCMQSTMNLAAAAWLFDNSDYFYIFTKRLVLDYCDRFSGLKGAPSGKVLSTNTLLALEEQRAKTRTQLCDDVFELSKVICPMAICADSGTADATFTARICSGMDDDQWPPSPNSTTLRNILIETRIAGPIELVASFRCSHGATMVRSKGDFRKLTGKIDNSCGLCLWCAKAGEAGPDFCNEHLHLKTGMEDPL